MEQATGASTMNRTNDDDFSKRAELGIRRGVARALARHKRKGQSIVVMREGKIVEIPPEKIEVPDIAAIDAEIEKVLRKEKKK